jgi:hypothetical protein
MKPQLLLFAPSLMASLLACTAPATAPDEEPALPDIDRAPPSVAETTARWEAPPDGAFGALASASASDEGAIAYAELQALDGGGSFTQTRILLQRLDSTGAPRGSSIELGVIESGNLSGLTLASDGNQYIACWADDSQIDCATAPVGQGGASPGQSMAGVSPSLAYGSGTWALAYGLSGKLAVVRLSNGGMADGSPASFEAGEDPYFQALPLLAATKLGFVLVGGDKVRVHTLDFAFSPVANTVDLGVMPWAFGAIAASETAVAIHLSEPYGSNLFLLEDGTLTGTLPFGGGGKLGLRAALAGEGASFGMIMPGVDAQGYAGGDLLYRMIEPGGDSISERAQDVDFNVVDEDPRTLLRLKDDVFVASIPQRQEIVVARIHRP